MPCKKTSKGIRKVFLFFREINIIITRFSNLFKVGSHSCSLQLRGDLGP